MRSAASKNHDKSILRTGCSSGIGYCAAQGLRARGYRVFANARQDRHVARLAAEGFDSLQRLLPDSMLDRVLRRV